MDENFYDSTAGLELATAYQNQDKAKHQADLLILIVLLFNFI